MADDDHRLTTGKIAYDMLPERDYVLYNDRISDPDRIRGLVDEFHRKAKEELGIRCFVYVTTNPDNGLSVTTYHSGGALVVNKDDVSPYVSENLPSETETPVEIPDTTESRDDSATYAYEKGSLVGFSTCAPPKIF